MRADDPQPLEAPLRHAAEFDVIRAIADALGDHATGLGDDAAVFDLPRGDACVVSVDASVEGVHFRREWLDAREIGYRAAAAAMSDLAAMAARPQVLLLALAVPRDWVDQVPEIARGVGELAAATGAKVAGGNLSAGRELSITTTVIGSALTPLRRTTLEPGDRIYVTGRLGGAAAALREFVAGHEPPPAHRERFARPAPRIRAAEWLASHGAVAGIDVSDGLLADLEHLAAASGLTIVLDAARVPRVDGVTLEEAVTSGEEYELVVGARHELDRAAFEARFGIPLTEIARAEAGAPTVVAHGIARVAKPPGHDHFST